jgi:hypothetical protein
MSAPDHEMLRPTRRWFRWQFGLRTLLGVMLIACVVFAYLAHYRQEYEREYDREQPAIKAIAEIGGKCEMSADAPRVACWLAPDKTSRVVAVDLAYRVLGIGCGPGVCIVQHSLHQRVTDDWLSRLAPLEHLESLDLSGNAVSAEGLLALRNLKRLKTLDLTDCTIKDSDLAELASFPQLQTLRLGGATIGDEGLRHIGAIASLEDLDIGRTFESRLSSDFLEEPGATRPPSTIDGLGYFRALPRLKKLCLGRANLSAAEIDVLQSLPCLDELGIDFSRITAAGVDRIRRWSGLRVLRLSHSGERWEIAAIFELRESRPDLSIVAMPPLWDESGSPSSETDEALPPARPTAISDAPFEPYRGPKSFPPPPPPPADSLP